ncbi:STAS domain-containing protein [Halioxenophilus sp. WMMB6]|uniref:STAS domain-containing protein n=1 Tax=Halioxenophilus sp. WMMB6 TaxID=3073815 RepID=UPI00295E89B4|nr:STAS domain-containing protein [Halioxenophilus sp. WMMB6]
MAISAKLDNSHNNLTINIIGRFDFSSHLDFRKSYEHLNASPESIEVNMRQATFVDSSALGMLLLLRDFAGEQQASVKISHCNNEVRQILEMANFSNLFTIC